MTCNNFIPVAGSFVQIAKILVVYNRAKSLDLMLKFIKIKNKHMEPHLVNILLRCVSVCPNFQS